MLATVEARVRLMFAVAQISAGVATETIREKNGLNVAISLIRGLLKSALIRSISSIGKGRLSASALASLAWRTAVQVV